MLSKKKRTGNDSENREQWLKAIPVKNCQYSCEPNGNFILQMPRSDNALLSKVINLFAKSPYFKIKLDERGSYIWENCDGEKTIDEICRILEAKFGDVVKPSTERTIQFMKQLYQYRLILFYHADGNR